MQSNASNAEADRRARLTTLLAAERAQAEADERARARAGPGGPAFLAAESRKVFSGEGGLAERMRRGKVGMVGGDGAGA
jgi:hypothetical protein